MLPSHIIFAKIHNSLDDPDEPHRNRADNKERTENGATTTDNAGGGILQIELMYSQTAGEDCQESGSDPILRAFPQQIASVRACVVGLEHNEAVGR